MPVKIQDHFLPEPALFHQVYILSEYALPETCDIYLLLPEQIPSDQYHLNDFPHHIH